MDLQAYFEAVRKRTLEYVKDLTPEKLDKKISLPPPPRDTTAAKTDRPQRSPFSDATVGSILLMNLTHLAQHVGEISCLRGHQRGLDK